MNIEDLYQKFLHAGSVSTDTRFIIPGSVFFALRGPKFNANAFAEEALQKGASFAVVDEREFATNDRCLLVDDTLKTLQLLARHHRDHLRIPVIGLTGSNGKTTTKELIHAVLSRKFKTLATKGNLNNHIGVPLTILAIDSAIEIAVVEMGANHVGEIAELAAIAAPTHGFITNIGKAHVGTFGGFKNIVKGKSELFQYLAGHNGQVFVNSHDEILVPLAERFDNPLMYPSKGDYYHCELIGADPFVKLKAENGEEVITQLIGGYNFENLAAALCLGKYFGIEPSAANAAIAQYTPGNMRSQVVQKGNNTIILDAYNANPSSMEAAINNLADMKATRKIAILGDMYELENESVTEHRNLGVLLRKKEIGEVYLTGKLIREALQDFPQAKYFATKEELVQHLKINRIDNATILVKASRGIGLETIVETL